MAEQTRALRVVMAGTLAVIGLAGWFWWQAITYEPWVSAPMEWRPWGEDFAAMPPTVLPKPDPVRATDLTITRDTENIFWAWDEPVSDIRREAREPLVSPVEVADANQVLHLPGGGKMWLLFAVMGYHPNVENENVERTKVIVRGRDWKPLNEAEFHELQRKELGKVVFEDWNLPSVDDWTMGFDLVFAFEGVDAISRTGDHEVWDRNTGVLIRNGGGYDGQGSLQPRTKSFQPRIEVLHGAELSFYLDFHYGTPLQTSIPAKVGSRFGFPDAGGEIVAMVHHAAGTISDRGNSLHLRLLESEDPPTIFGVSFAPAKNSRGVAYGLVDSSGKERRYVHWNEVGRIHTIAYFLPPEDISEVTVDYLPNRVRAVFHFPALLGVPEGNEDVENLFNVRVPFAKLDRPQDFCRLIEGLAQVRIHGSLYEDSVEFPSGYFPKEFRDVTVAELWEEYISHLKVPTAIRMHPDGGYVLEPKEPFSPVEWARNKWRRLTRLP